MALAARTGLLLLGVLCLLFVVAASAVGWGIVSVVVIVVIVVWFDDFLSFRACDNLPFLNLLDDQHLLGFLLLVFLFLVSGTCRSSGVF